MTHQIYLLLVLIVVVGAVIYYYTQEAAFRKEVDKIDRLETIRKRQDRQMEEIRARSEPCPIGNFPDPRTCYFDSGYTCSWNENAKRCDLRK